MKIHVITSRSNSAVRFIRGLSSRKGRDEAGLWLLEGADFVREAVAAGVRPRLLAVTPESRADCADLLGNAGRIAVLSPDIMRYVSLTETGTTALAVIAAPGHSVEDAVRGPDQLVVVLDGIQDPGNVGTIARAAEALGATGLVAGPETADWGNPKVLRASAGALLHLPFASAPDLGPVFAMLKAAGTSIVVADPRGSARPWTVRWTSPSALVLGSEAHGASEVALSVADVVVSIPHRGRTGSLNVSTAGAILLFEATRARGAGG